ncbi:MAG: DUF4129 domain-containing protein [Bacteroidota bacterium]
MNKLLLLLSFFICTISSAQDSVAVAKKNPVTYTQKDIQIDNSVVSPPKFNPKFKSKYQDSDFQYEVKVEEKGTWDRFLQWLSGLFKRLFGLSDGVSQNAVNITLKVIATLIVLYVIYLIVKVILNKEGQWIFGKSSTTKIIHHDDIERNLQHVDFEKLIASTLKSNNQRLAIRYYYLWLLKKMSEKDIIDWHPDKTNSDYFYEIKSEALKQDFSYVSYLYNYIWYGEFDITETSFESIKKTFETTLQSIK